MAKRGFQGAMMRATQARDHVCTVTGSELVVPGFMRVYQQSDTVFEDLELAPTAWLRFWFPDHTGKDFEHQRAYTISSANVETGEFAIDLVLHEPAEPASAWAKTCVPGDMIEAMSLGSSKFELPEELPAGYLLVGASSDGWDARVGEGGSALSGGERQRVSIARALLKPAPVLLVDEATSALDTENEAAVAAALSGDAVPRTRVIVAHRLSSIFVADRVLFVDDGRVVEDGTAEELIAAGGRFAEYHAHQQAASNWQLGADDR